MKWYIVICSSLLILCMACDNSYLFFSHDTETIINRKSQRGDRSSTDGVAFYFIKDFDHKIEVNLDSVELEDEPFIAYENIVAYDSSAHIFQLNFDVRFSSLFNGFVVVVDGEKIYNGVLVSPISSFTVDAITLTEAYTDTLSGQCFELMSAYPSSQFSSKAVNLNDERLISRLFADGKLRILVAAPKPEPGPTPLPSFLDTLYYQNEIFSEENQAIYGKWKLNSISGGLTGTGYEPDFDYLEFMSYGIYQFVRADTLLEFGRVAIAEQSDDVLFVTLKVDNSSTSFFPDSEKYIELNKSDVLNLIAPCCDRYNYHFTRMK